MKKLSKRLGLSATKPTLMCKMTDVARLADVSVATVSAVINGTARVSSALTERVQNAMEALDYHPDQIARSLKIGKSRAVGMIIPDVANEFYSGVMRGVEDVARQNGYSVIFCNSNEDSEQERLLLGELFARRVDGVVLASADPHGAYDRLNRRRFPLVFIDRIPQDACCCAVATDNAEAAQAAVRHLIDLGHNRIAIIGGPLRLSPFISRLEGFRRAMQEANLVVRDSYMKEAMPNVEDGYRCTLELLRLAEPPTAIFACNNKLMLGIIRALLELHVRVPQRISVIGFDDFLAAEYLSPALTTVAQPMFDLGRVAMERLLRMMREGSPAGPTDADIVLLKAALIIRQSTAPPDVA